MKNKKSTLDIVIFVVMVLVICLYALVQIVSYRNKFDYKLKGFEQLEEIALEKKDLEYRLEKYLEQCTINSYFFLIKKEEFYESKNIDGILFFDKIRENLNELLREKIITCLVTETDKDYNKFENKEEYPNLKLMLELLKEKDFELKVEDTKVFLDLKKQIESKNLEIEKKYIIGSEINLKREGILPFTYINKTILCKGEIICTETLTKNIFEVKIEEKEEIKNNKKISYLQYNFSSKKDFYIEKKFEKLFFNIKFLEKIEELNV
ncbi:MAG: hypothetical protein QXG18_01455 [Candidatus Pacearchaeota archaeon]